MQAWVVDTPGPLETGPLRRVDRPLPEPGTGQVRVRITCCGVCRTDLHLADGDLRPRRPGVTPGHEVVGHVEALGPGAQRFTLGEPQKKSSREQAAGALVGYATGLGIAAAYGLVLGRRTAPPAWLAAPLLGAAAMAGSDVPATALGATDPKTWSRTAWISDIVPHLVYGAVTASAFQAIR